MSDFNLRAPSGANKRKKVVGRGQASGRGTTSGRGNKGQYSRSGRKAYAGFEGGQMPLYRRVAQRGFSNYPFKVDYQIVNLDQIEARYEAGDTVDEASLITKSLIKRRKKPVKILGNGTLTKKLSFKVEKLSASAREKIENAGGTIADSAKA